MALMMPHLRLVDIELKLVEFVPFTATTGRPVNMSQ